MATATAAYQCSECNSINENEDDAAVCCKPKVHEGWKCDECGAFYTRELDAKECCNYAFPCVACGAFWSNEDEATDCCGIEYIAPPASPK